MGIYMEYLIAITIARNYRYCYFYGSKAAVLFFLKSGNIYYIFEKYNKRLVSRKGNMRNMRQLTAVEVLSLTKLLEMESNALTVAQASLMAVSDEQLKTLTQSGIAATQARITGLQQFVVENKITAVGARLESQAQNANVEV